MITPADVAVSQLGIKEATGRNDGEPSTRYMGGRKEPWCMHFALWCFSVLGYFFPGHIAPTLAQHNPIARVKTMWEKAKAAGLIVDKPQRSDLVIFNSRGNSDAGDGWHVGIVNNVFMDVTADGVAVPMIDTIEGNEGNGVKPDRHRVADKRIVAFVRHPSLRDSAAVG